MFQLSRKTHARMYAKERTTRARNAKNNLKTNRNSNTETNSLTFINVTFRLFHKFANEDDSGSGAISTSVILRHSGPCNHNRRRVLDLLRSQQSKSEHVPP